MKVLSLAVVIALGAFVLNAQTSSTAGTVGVTPKKILFIGNSLTYYNDGVWSHMEKLAASGAPPLKIETGNAVAGGQYFKTLWEKYPAPRQAIARGYDVVVLQEDLPETTVADFRAYAPRFVEEIRKTGARPVLLMAWGYRRLNWMPTTDIAKVHSEVAKQLNVDVAPVGLAWERVMKERPDLNLFDRDYEHPNIMGTYLETLVVYATVFKDDPSRFPYAPPGVNAQASAFLKKVAWETVQQYKL